LEAFRRWLRLDLFIFVSTSSFLDFKRTYPKVPLFSPPPKRLWASWLSFFLGFAFFLAEEPQFSQPYRFEPP
jgi:hypothetical protein